MFYFDSTTLFNWFISYSSIFVFSFETSSNSFVKPDFENSINFSFRLSFFHFTSFVFFFKSSKIFTSTLFLLHLHSPNKIVFFSSFNPIMSISSPPCHHRPIFPMSEWISQSIYLHTSSKTDA